MEIHGSDIFFVNVQVPVTADLILPTIKKHWPDLVCEEMMEDNDLHLFIHPNSKAEAAWNEEGWSEENDTTLIYVIWDKMKGGLTFVIDDNKKNMFIINDVKEALGL